MTDLNDATPTEPLPPQPAETPVAPQAAQPTPPAEQPAPEQPAYAPQPAAAPAAAPVSRRTAIGIGVAAVAILLAAGVFASGIAVGTRVAGGGHGRQGIEAGRQPGPGAQGQLPGGMQQGQRGQDLQQNGGRMQGRPDMLAERDDDRGFDDDDRSQGGRRGRGFRHPGGALPQGMTGQGSIAPTSAVPAVPGQ